MKIAIITTVYNRKEKTKKAITSLQNGLKDMEYIFYICDDGSTDGTETMLQNLDCPISVIEGNGELFWSRGMYSAMNQAAEDGADLYLMVNNDVEFIPEVMNIMLESYEAANGHCGIVGSTKSIHNGEITYGGRNINDPKLIVPDGKLHRCDLTNWNCFLIDDYVLKNIGLIDDYYEHGLGDFDYSLRMNTAGIPIYVAIDYVGYCENNSKVGTYHDKNTTIRKRVSSMFSRRNLPIASRWHYYSKNFGVKGVKDFIWPYIKCTYCIIMRKDY